MAESRFGQSEALDLPAADLSAEMEMLRGSNRLPQLSSHLRARVLNAARLAHQQARRWAQARQAAAFLGVCLVASFVLSSLANVDRSSAASVMAGVAQFRPAVTIAATKRREFTWPSSSVWALRHNPAFLELPAAPAAKPRDRLPTTVARAESVAPRDELLTALQTSEGWATVEAFEAIRARGRFTLQRALWAN